MSTKQNQNDEVWNWPFKWSFRCRFCLGCAITNKIKQHKPYKCYPLPKSNKITTNWTLHWNPNEEIAQLRRSGLLTTKIIGSISAGLSVRGKSAGSFPEQQLVIELTSSFRMERNIGNNNSNWVMYSNLICSFWYSDCSCPIVVIRCLLFISAAWRCLLEKINVYL